MRIPRLYVKQPLASGQVVDLDAAASRYIGSVLRMEVGRPLIVFNGEGGEFLATVHSAGKKQVSIGVGKFNADNRESPLTLALGIGLSKGDRFDWVIQKATELGVNEITPLLTSRAEVKLNAERAEKKLAHWQQIAISASEQCQRNVPPVINAPAKLDDWLGPRAEELKLVLHHRSDKTLSQHEAPKSAALLIGPEGGLDDDEIQAARAQGFQQLTLGPRVFRTETAPIVALSLLQYQWGDF
ncbi:16S rRNA (uracil(1498)-N(3))-methyltransferase [Simiduia sp. 21SJ11W-1]|uniref:16S rRNA (uracil(1498)-N(3))-methyltransferase n=1 Tax=Simiduia sp. 21SJ11W-1 TaxID=2909669 RepID=UPI00209DC015|nr:16S rRNA (uracil(1498)-N(3))-methyltransferase [Simiduia sp. 21SJ11W-1]UTA48237.1 16S rRNA (uracil(1498)-N(3))-methyltransferase [Simiduia sp. 21SJ11W-1]